ncbi:MAG: hypothetical protein H6828_12325 [Planctomycetes bacterium]|nr:hypothetical protein [Planctomycetota bacterium]
MRFHKFVLTGLTALAGLGMASEAVAGGRNPGSLLLYPEFDNRAGTVTVLTITNTADSGSAVDVEFVYIGRYQQCGGPGSTSGGHCNVDCEEFNRTERLTANDTLTLITNFHNPQHEQGYVYAFARDGVNSPIAHNYLIGNVMTVESLETFEYSVNPVVYTANNPADGNNGIRLLNGTQYEEAADEILFPRFLGQGGNFNSELILIGLTGGAAFDTTVDFLIYNDNEEVFSSEYTFYCWDRVHLLEISGIFHNQFLADFTNDDSQELLGAPHVETGWFRMDGAQASSTSTTLPNPAVYGVLVERIDHKGAADLPFENGTQDNGALLPRSLDGTF